MRGSSSAEGAPWWEVALDWPVEHVSCQLEVVEPRLLTALEWAVLRVLEAFGDAAPSLEETVEELGLGEPLFLTDVLDTLVTHQALEPRPGVDSPAWLDEVQFTERGRQLFRRGQLDGEPRASGYALCFDVLTDEPLDADVACSSRPRCPLIDPASLPAPREEVGLERVRSIVQRFGPAMGGADALIRSARVLSPGEAMRSRSGHSWVTHSLGLVPTPQGRFALRTPSLSEGQRSRLVGHTLDRWVTPARAVTGTWAPHAPFRRDRQSLAALRARTERLVPVSQVIQEARRLISGARRELLLHAAWSAAPELAEALATAATRGVAVHVLGAPATRIATWSVAAQRAPGFVFEVSSAAMEVGALVVDGSEALLLDEVLAEVEDFGRYAFEIVGATRVHAAARCLELRRALLDALPTETLGEALRLDLHPAQDVDASVRHLLGEPRLHRELARFALAPSETSWSRIEAWLNAHSAGVDRVAVIQQVAELAGRLAPDTTPAPWREAGTKAWWVVFSAISAAPSSAIPEAALQALLKLAPPGTTAEAVLEPLVARWVSPSPATRSPEALRLLGRLRQRIEAHWQDAAPRCPGFRAALAECLRVTAPAPEGPLLAELARLVASVAPGPDTQSWAWAVAAQWPAPLQLSAFEDWKRRHEPLRSLLGLRLPVHFTQHWRALLQAEPSRTTDRMTEQLHCIQGVLSAADAVDALGSLPGLEAVEERVEHLVRLRLACRAVWKQETPKDEFWNQHLRALLTVPPEGYSAELHGPLLEELTRRLRSWSDAEAVLRAWARELLKTIPPVIRAEGVAWWLEALQGVARTLGPDLRRMAISVVSQHMTALRDARQGATPLWTDVREAWNGLGLEPAVLEALLEPPPPTRSADDPRNRKQKGKKR